MIRVDVRISMNTEVVLPFYLEEEITLQKQIYGKIPPYLMKKIRTYAFKTAMESMSGEYALEGISIREKDKQA